MVQPTVAANRLDAVYKWTTGMPQMNCRQSKSAGASAVFAVLSVSLQCVGFGCFPLQPWVGRAFVFHHCWLYWLGTLTDSRLVLCSITPQLYVSMLCRETKEIHFSQYNMYMCTLEPQLTIHSVELCPFYQGSIQFNTFVYNPNTQCNSVSYIAIGLKGIYYIMYRMDL